MEEYLHNKYLILYILLLSSFSVFCQKTEKEDSISYYQKELNKLAFGEKKAEMHLSFSEFYNSKDQSVKAYEEIFKALAIYEKIGNQEQIAECNLKIYVYSTLKKEDETAKKYLDRYYNYAKQQKDTNKLAQAHKQYGIVYFDVDHKKSRKHFEKAIKYALIANDSLLWAKSTNNLALLLAGYDKKQDSALMYYRRVLDFYKKKENSSRLLLATYVNIANSYEKKNDIDKALFYIKKTEIIPSNKLNAFYKEVISEKLSKYYKWKGDYKKALEYKEVFIKMKDSIEYALQDIAISELQTKYETEKKENENILLKSDIAKKEQKETILIIVVIASIIIGTGISVLIAKNAKRKQELAKQKEKLKLQEVEKELKEQELSSIDILIEGQEKERQRLAENLHDNLGGTLAAIKLNMQNLQQNKNNETVLEKSINNSLNLIDDAYQNVRNMAHEKSNGVVASQGLLPAIQKFVNNISSKKLEINVDHFGLKSRLDNSLEIRIFRIIQELITNIIKHANATEANISLTNHDSTLNIIVEDNGIGFKKGFSNSEGLGIASIEKRIESLGGTLEIDSSPNIGSSIIINLPL
ncbi:MULTISPECIES: tetratricopeptide repeat-containing sensor histidine kinase [Mesonia]|uniref:Oxygen sensor histidine kinase NreB n=1 Tax=Mesonia oceanica TaxID=2687242 RepID=A0AC61Y810_9FLAO|nr:MULTISPECIES: ATP-binding protein [Mesonia]MBJ97031.1 hypothetical protein [Flavobacteriaceae bacterium]MAN29491.1 hypothetical protein [Mesonia sp.]MAQ39470.1 hypothetical protein [Mesonia sp.]MAQ42145.1 hypothetical protein [Mesonia sp.]VVV00617.1 Oxygen sensor histidine kinase NreB [Mesonia oceanica]|tara:strand:+ start:81793 stop:83541 length:1749 start_codon:yes stop_codon:yes gene_type:complete